MACRRVWRQRVCRRVFPSAETDRRHWRGVGGHRPAWRRRDRACPPVCRRMACRRACRRACPPRACGRHHCCAGRRSGLCRSPLAWVCAALGRCQPDRRRRRACAVVRRPPRARLRVPARPLGRGPVRVPAAVRARGQGGGRRSRPQPGGARCLRWGARVCRVRVWAGRGLQRLRVARRLGPRFAGR